jgi:SAM-dependent methyltransferase
VSAQSLSGAVEEFVALEAMPACGSLLYAAFTTRLHRLFYEAERSERDGVLPGTIRAILEPAREIVGRAPFVNRLQTWPRGYMGDFETIEAMTEPAPEPPHASLAECSQAWALRCPPTQHYRNKLRLQADLIRRTVRRHRDAHIALIACGGCADAATVIDALAASNCRITLNDSDPDALRLAMSRLAPLPGRVSIVEGSALRRAGQLKDGGSYDAIILGGLFDYLSDAQISFLLSKLRPALAPGGCLLFTNIVRDNPYRACMEFLVNWHLIERSREDVLRFCRDAKLEPVSVVTEETGLAWIVEATERN